MSLEGTTGEEQAQETMLKEGMNVFMLFWAKKYFEEIVRHFCDIHFWKKKLNKRLMSLSLVNVKPFDWSLAEHKS